MSARLESAGKTDRPVSRAGKSKNVETKLAPGAGSASRGTVFRSYYGAEPLARIDLIRGGLSAREAKAILADFPITQANLLRALKISPATINRKAQGEDRLLPAESERILGVARLVGQAQAIVEQSGNPEHFDATAWVSRWLGEPLPALNGLAPLEMLDTMEGQSLVAGILARVQSGAYT